MFQEVKICNSKNKEISNIIRPNFEKSQHNLPLIILLVFKVKMEEVRGKKSRCYMHILSSLTYCILNKFYLDCKNKFWLTWNFSKTKQFELLNDLTVKTETDHYDQNAPPYWI